MARKPPKQGKFFRLTASQIQFVDALVANGMLGTNDSEVVRALLDRGIQDLVKTDYVRLHQETLERLKPK